VIEDQDSSRAVKHSSQMSADKSQTLRV